MDTRALGHSKGQPILKGWRGLARPFHSAMLLGFGAGQQVSGRRPCSPAADCQNPSISREGARGEPKLAVWQALPVRLRSKLFSTLFLIVFTKPVAECKQGKGLRRNPLPPFPLSWLGRRPAPTRPAVSLCTLPPREHRGWTEGAGMCPCVHVCVYACPCVSPHGVRDTHTR